MKHLVRRLSTRRRSRRMGLRLSAGGMLSLLGIALIGLAAIDGDINLLLILFGLCLGALLQSLTSGWFALRGLTIKRIVPDVLFAGQVHVVHYLVTNKRRWTSAKSIHVLDVLCPSAPLASPEAYVPILRPGETIRLSTPVLPRGRGRVRFSRIAFATRFPFGFFTKYTTIRVKHESIVFPALGRLLADVKTTSGFSGSATSGSMARFTGDEEYWGVREYRIGDDPRRIHWRRSARTGQLVIREMARMREPQLWCVVNTRIDLDDARQRDHLELAISCAATVICDALERGVKVGLICNGRPRLVLPPGGGRAHRPRLLGELAIRSPDYDDLLSDLIRRFPWPARWRGPCMLFGAARNDDLSDAAGALDRTIGPTTTYVPQTPAFDGLFQAAVASRCDVVSNRTRITGGVYSADVLTEVNG